jgi:hypothetical protein
VFEDVSGVATAGILRTGGAFGYPLLPTSADHGGPTKGPYLQETTDYDHRQEILDEIEAGLRFAEQFKREHPESVR